jgi:hypothetical protein
MADAHVLASAVFVTHSALLNATCIFFCQAYYVLQLHAHHKRQ